MLEWLVEEYRNYGCTLEIVSDKTQEGSQFCRGLGGIGALLRYAVPMYYEDNENAAAIEMAILLQVMILFFER